MSGSPAYEQEKDHLALFLQAAISISGKVRAVGPGNDIITECEPDGLGEIWRPRRSRAMHEAEVEYDERGQRIPPELQKTCSHAVHVIEGWSPALGMMASCYSCYQTFYWSMRSGEYVSVNIPGPLHCPSRQALEGFLGSSLQRCPDYVDAELWRRITCGASLRATG